MSAWMTGSCWVPLWLRLAWGYRMDSMCLGELGKLQREDMSSTVIADNYRRRGSDLDLLVILEPTLKHWYAYQMVYPWSLFFVKASILALYHRIFTQTKFRRLVYAVTAFVSTYTIVVFFVNAFECPKNPSQAWSPTFPAGCNNLPATYFSTASINILTDVMILLMPIRAFWQLQLHPRKRWALLGVFLVGGIAAIASIVRLYALYVYTTTQDVAYDAIFILLLSQIEVNVAIISASAPALRPLFNKTFMSTSYNRSKYGAGYGSGMGSNLRSRAKSNGQIELYSYDANKETGTSSSGTGTKHTRGGTSVGSNTSEESILRAGGSNAIMKTTEMRIDVEPISQTQTGRAI
ncbi:uncharacterized protein N0V89_001052 [Didymosphaeria variabile]|uniref:Rhodopsin domain-containing protein n=1 Tax=Didymosphaeria variabile TaxID=1932322 RepID=A0A9W8XVF0_9PLEO|nr:uncharacterized protein N0V89_001052 [Didymosphaeria variabile]KAJ4360487.1 hypothetical protein N0V89_001052 [Didymosphaeria variabile]